MQSRLIALLAGQRGHFQMESGYHTDTWYELDRLFQQPEELKPFVAELATRLAQHRIDGVCGPVVGGARLAAGIATLLKLETFITERHEMPPATGLFPVQYLVPKSERARVKGKRLAIVDDAISAGSAVRGTLADLRVCGAHVVAIGSLFVFGGVAERLAQSENLALESVAAMPLQLWRPEECPLCRENIPFQKVSDVAPPARVGKS